MAGVLDPAAALRELNRHLDAASTSLEEIVARGDDPVRAGDVLAFGERVLLSQVHVRNLLVVVLDTIRGPSWHGAAGMESSGGRDEVAPSGEKNAADASRSRGTTGPVWPGVDRHGFCEGCGWDRRRSPEPECPTPEVHIGERLDERALWLLRDMTAVIEGGEEHWPDDRLPLRQWATVARSIRYQAKDEGREDVERHIVGTANDIDRTIDAGEPVKFFRAALWLDAVRRVRGIIWAGPLAEEPVGGSPPPSGSSAGAAQARGSQVALAARLKAADDLIDAVMEFLAEADRPEEIAPEIRAAAQVAYVRAREHARTIASEVTAAIEGAGGAAGDVVEPPSSAAPSASVVDREHVRRVVGRESAVHRNAAPIEPHVPQAERVVEPVPVPQRRPFVPLDAEPVVPRETPAEAASGRPPLGPFEVAAIKGPQCPECSDEMELGRAPDGSGDAAWLCRGKRADRPHALCWCPATPPPLLADDWRCPECGADNDGAWLTCDQCGHKRPDERVEVVSTQHVTADEDPSKLPSWNCEDCGQRNTGWAVECGRCGATRPDIRAAHDLKETLREQHGEPPAGDESC